MVVMALGTLVLGIDGLGLEGLNALASLGCMGAVKEFVMRYAVADNVRTIFPPQTVPVWPSIFSGVNPGKHGVFSFFNARKGRTNVRLDVNFPYLHEIFALNGRRVLVDGAPLSYPPLVVNGVYISDWLAPSSRIIVKHQQKNILLDILSEYKHVDLSLKRRNWRIFSRKAASALERRRWVIEGILEGDYVDDAFIVISELDWVFHSFYNLIINKKIPKFLKPLLRAIDRFVSSIIKLGSRYFENFAIIADHGFHVYRKIVFINEILRRMKLCDGLELRIVGGLRVRHIASQTRFREIVYLGLYNLAIKAKLAMAFPDKFYKYIIRHGIRPLPSPRRSLAFALLNMPAMFILLNPKVARNERLIDKLITKLRNVQHDGKKVLGFVAKRNEIFFGPYLKYAPHIGIFGNVDNDVYLSPLLVGLFVLKKTINYHDFKPVFAMRSKTSEITKVNLSTVLDLAPTIYALEDMPAPYGLDGINLSDRKLQHREYRTILKTRRILLARRKAIR